ncbi:MAG: response regulator [Planctomycetota bacterium]
MTRVLIVDDSKFMAKGMQAILQKMDYEIVALAHDGQQGLDAFETHHPDVTLLDVTMPNMDGVHCLQRLREMDSDARVVMLSAVQDAETVARCMEHGASSFLQKPIRPSSPSDLARLLDSLEEAASKAV